MKRLSALLAAILAVTPAAAHDQPSGMRLSPEDAAASRAAAEGFYTLGDALAAGYEKLFDCTDAGADGAMGQHFINTAYATDGRLDVARPDVLMYEPQPDGTMHLVALEYIVFEAQWTGARPPVFLGHDLKLKHKVGTHEVDPFYELHVWHWRDNPSGMVADYNPAVTCVHSDE